MQTEYFIRTQSDRAHTYGVGESIIPGVALFRDGCWGLTLAEAEALLASKTKVKVNP
jgi:hypothetical protein